MHPALAAARRIGPGLVLAVCLAVLAGCERPASTNGESPQVAAAMAAIQHKLDSPDYPEFRNVIEYKDGVVCGEVNRKKRFSGTEMGFRKFIYNAPEPGQLSIDSGELTREEISYWCSEQPDKRLRMLAASVAELGQACQAAGNKSSEISCRLAEAQKRSLEELQATAGHKAPAPAPALAAAAVPVATASSPAPAPAASSPAPALAASSPAPVSPGKPVVAAVPAEVDVALQTWRERWQAGDVEGYLRLYEASFTGGTRSRAEWEQQRRQKMKDARPAIGIEQLQAVRVAPQEVELRFVQVYSARQHRDRGDKTLVFRRSPQGWLIADERWAAL